MASSPFSGLAASQRQSQLLHGDSNHDNVLFDSKRGWTVIDPKGSQERSNPRLGRSSKTPRRHFRLASHPQLSSDGFAASPTGSTSTSSAQCSVFAQAVLSLVWSLEDGDPVTDSDPVLLLATSMAPLLSPP